MSISELKDLSNKLVGSWHCEQIDETFTFHFNEKIFQTEGKLTIVNKKSNYKSFEAFYGVGTYLNLELTEKTYYYIDIGWFEKRYYKIESITTDLLILREYWMEIDKPEAKYVLMYRKVKPDMSKADEILQGLDLGE